jgi:hypothetical protein
MFRLAQRWPSAHLPAHHGGERHAPMRVRLARRKR